MAGCNEIRACLRVRFRTRLLGTASPPPLPCQRPGRCCHPADAATGQANGTCSGMHGSTAGVTQSIPQGSYTATTATAALFQSDPPGPLQKPLEEWSPLHFKWMPLTSAGPWQLILDAKPPLSIIGQQLVAARASWLRKPCG